MSTNNDNNDGDCCAMKGKRCICMAYNDALMITAAVLSAIAFLISWIWWVTWLISLAGMIMFQVLWCCRQPAGCMYVYIIIAGLCSVCSIGSGIWVATRWRDNYLCVPFYFFSYEYEPVEQDDYWNRALEDALEDVFIYQDDFFNQDDDFFNQNNDDFYIDPSDFDLCFQNTYAGIAIVCGCLWAIVTICITIFVVSGRHARFEEKFNNPTASAVEVPSRAAPPPAAATPVEATPIEARTY